MSSNPLDPVLEWYRTARDSMRVTKRVVEKSIPGAITEKHVFHECKGDGARLVLLDNASKELDRVVVLALTAIFERALRTHLSRITLAALPVGEPQKEAFLKAILDDIERWNFTRIVDLFPNVPTDLRGQIR